MEVGEEEIIYLSPHCHHQNDSCIKTGSDESNFTVRLIVRDVSYQTMSTKNNRSEEKGQPKWYRNVVLLLTSLTPYR